MKAFITTLLIGVFLGAGGFWIWNGSYRPPVLKQSASQEENKGRSSLNGDGQTEDRSGQFDEGKLAALELQADSVQEELRTTGQVVRRRARGLGSAIMDTAADVKITSAIKAKLATDPKLSAWKISVNTSSRIVTLSGTVSSPDRIGRAVMLALETDDVTEVVSTIQISQTVPGSTQSPIQQPQSDNPKQKPIR